MNLNNIKGNNKLYNEVYITSYCSYSFKFCIHCKHFITDNKENIFGKCKMFPQIENKLNYLMVSKKMDIHIVQPLDNLKKCVEKMEKCLKSIYLKKMRQMRQ